jgi:transcriptional regulator with XRE-family HTH domain
MKEKKDRNMERVEDKFNEAVFGVTVPNMKATLEWQLEKWKEQGGNLSSFAKFLEIDPSYLTRVIKGQQSISLKVALTIASKLNMSLDALLGGPDYARKEMEDGLGKSALVSRYPILSKIIEEGLEALENGDDDLLLAKTLYKLLETEILKLEHRRTKR